MELLRKSWQWISGANKTRGVAYIAYGEPGLYAFLFDSIKHLRKFTDMPISVICDDRAEKIVSKRDPSINTINVIGIENDIDLRKGKYAKCFKPKLNAMKHLPYDTTIVLDCECFFERSFEHLIDETYDIGYCKEANYNYGTPGREWDHKRYISSINSGFNLRCSMG